MVATPRTRLIGRYQTGGEPGTGRRSQKRSPARRAIASQRFASPCAACLPHCAPRQLPGSTSIRVE